MLDARVIPFDSDDPVSKAFWRAFHSAIEGLAEFRECHAASPDNLELRAQLLGALVSLRGLTAPSEEYLREAEWWIREQTEFALAFLVAPDGRLPPQDPGYRRLKHAWLASLADSPENADLLAAVGSFLSVHDPDHAIELLERASRLEPTNAYLLGKRGRIWLNHAEVARRRGDAKTEALASNEALRLFTRALKIAKEPPQRGDLIGPACLAAFFAKQFDQARSLTAEALDLAATFPLCVQDSDAAYSAHEVLGLFALTERNMDRARQELQLAALALKDRHVPTGISLNLADALLLRSDNAAVRAFLSKVRRTWMFDHEQIYEWCRQIKRGDSPPLRRLEPQ